MANAAITSFIADLKLTPDGGVKILELGRAFYCSSFYGYRTLNNNADPLERYVMPLIRSHNLWVWQSYDDDCNGEEFYADRLFLPDRKKLMPEQAASLSNYRGVLLKRNIEVNERGDDNDFLIYDRNSTLRVCYDDKACLASIVAPEAPDLFPKQKIYPIRGRCIDIKTVLQDFKGHASIVIKAPDRSQGEGIGVFSTERLQTLAERDLEKNDAALRSLAMRRGYMVVQEHAKGLPVHHAGRAFDPTMRILMTAVHTDGNTTLHGHMAYYKLPKDPIGGDINAAALSDVKKGCSFPVPEQDRQHVLKTVETGLTPVFHSLFTRTREQVARDLLTSRNPETCLGGFMLTSDPHYTVFNQNEMSAGLPDLRAAFATAHAHLISPSCERRLRDETGGSGWQSFIKAVAGLRGARL